MRFFSRYMCLSLAYACPAPISTLSASVIYGFPDGWNDTSEEALKLEEDTAIATNLKRLDMGRCRGVDDWFKKNVLEQCGDVDELKVWGCQRVTEHRVRKVSMC